MKTITAVLLGSIFLSIFLGACTPSSAPSYPGVEIQPAPAEEPTAPLEKVVPTETSKGTQEHLVEMTSAGFVPETITLSAGDRVTWVNKDSKTRWPASAIHPTHETYPNSSIRKCNTPKEKETFDACRQLTPGREYSFTFTEKGTWKYHDHLHPTLKGTVIVE